MNPQRFSSANLVETKVVDKELMGKPFMPGGTLARYKKGKKEYEMFVAKLPTATDAAILLPDWRKALTDSKLVPSFGGYFGLDAGRPVFVFSKMRGSRVLRDCRRKKRIRKRGRWLRILIEHCQTPLGTLRKPGQENGKSFEPWSVRERAVRGEETPGEVQYDSGELFQTAPQNAGHRRGYSLSGSLARRGLRRSRGFCKPLLHPPPYFFRGTTRPSSAALMPRSIAANVTSSSSPRIEETFSKSGVVGSAMLSG